MKHTLDPALSDGIKLETAATARLRPIRVALVDGDEAARLALAEWIGESAAFRVVRSCSDAESALNHLPVFRPDVVVTELILPGMNGVEFVRRLKAQLPKVQVLLFTTCEDQDRLLQSLIAGASGFLLKHASPGRLLTAIREVHEGGAPMSPEIARRILYQLRQSAGALPEPVKLTPREQEILDQLSKGFRYKEIVENLGISFGTLHSYISKVYEKLHVHSRTEAVVKYLNL